MIEKQKEIGFKRCPECFEIVPLKVKICPSCRSYQDWRRYVSIGQINLALLIALISVITTFLNVGLPYFRSKESDIKLLFVSSSGSKATFVARNDGISAGTLSITHFSIHKADESSVLSFENLIVGQGITHEGVVLEPGKLVRFDVDMDKAIKVSFENLDEIYKDRPDDLKRDLYDRKKLACGFSFRVTDFYQSEALRRLPLPFGCFEVLTTMGVLRGGAFSREAPRKE